MTDNRGLFDVFISHGMKESALASEVANDFIREGIGAVTSAMLSASGDSGDDRWDALAQSNAVVAIVPPSGPPPRWPSRSAGRGPGTSRSTGS